MRLLIFGSRTFDDYSTLKKLAYQVLVSIFKERFPNEKTDFTKLNIEIVQGGANGADLLGKRFAKEHGFVCKQFDAEWDNL
jgi:hypothetical protein